MNVQSLNTKVNDTLHLFDSRKLDILLLQETCLDRESLNATARMAKKRQMTFHAANPH
jgi:exonuclease III